jgi:hypothetical protein
VNRLDLTQTKDSKTLDEFISGMQEKGAHGKTKGAVSGVTSAIGDAAQRFTHRDDDDDEGSDDGHQPRRRASAAPRRRRPPEDREG